MRITVRTRVGSLKQGSLKMSNNAYQSKSNATIRLEDWRPYPFTVQSVNLDFTLDIHATVIRSEITFRQTGPKADLELDGSGLATKSIAIDGKPLSLDLATATRLVIPAEHLPEGDFIFTAEVEITPSANTALEGLYVSGGIFCTQCEAEGFRHITWYPDRPDVMAPFTVTINSDQPVLLSNGNLVSETSGKAVWHDPWPKPSYLFAVVAGELSAITDSFKTLSGREVALNIWVREGDQPRAGFAMEALKNSMAWDEEVYGRGYDLDVFNLVAVDDFNMGAMENKGLNIFNSKLVLADRDTATDADFERIESVIAHEYFHNWTGNRITCRDWFQLCLKEGLTVYRDQQFTSDMRSAAVKRIEDVKLLRSRQFREDGGPLSHPPRPSEYKEINNFYTVTVYEKGAEIVRMLHRLVGDEGYYKALDLYFRRHDGQACSIEDWLQVFEDATGRDLGIFSRWYMQAGTPEVTLHESWDSSSNSLSLQFIQKAVGGPRHIPVALGMLDQAGTEIMPTRLLELTQQEEVFTFSDLASRPVLSVLRGFSAPVTLKHEQSPQDLALLLAHDTDPFARWEAGYKLALAELTGAPDCGYLDALGSLIASEDLDPAFLALCLALPGTEEVAAQLHATGRTPDPTVIHLAREELARRIASQHHDKLTEIYEASTSPVPYRPDADASGKRALRLAVLSLLTRIDGPDRAFALARKKDNMTERGGAIAALIRAGAADEALEDLQADFSENALVMDKFFSVQAQTSPPQSAVAVAVALSQRQDFDWKNPNRFRSLIGAFAANYPAFHLEDGSGYDFVADWIIKMDPINPQTAARTVSVFETWSMFGADRKKAMQKALFRIQQQNGLSRNTAEMVERILSVSH